MNRNVVVPGGGLKLQATLSSSSSGTGDALSPHHPITCNGELRLEHDNTLCCDHSAAPPGDIRSAREVAHNADPISNTRSISISALRTRCSMPQGLSELASTT